VINEPTKENTLLDQMLRNKEEWVRDLKAGDCLGCSDHETEKFRTLQGANKAKSGITAVVFMRTGFFLFMDLLGRIPWDMALERIGVQESCLIFKDFLFQAP